MCVSLSTRACDPDLSVHAPAPAWLCSWFRAGSIIARGFGKHGQACAGCGMRRHGKQRRPRAWCGEHRHLGAEVAIAASSTGSSSARHSGHVLRAARGRAQARAQGCSVSACSNEEHRADPCARVACARGCTHCSAGRIRRADTRVLAPPTANPRPAPAAARPRRQARPVELVPARLPAVGLHHRHAHHHARAPAELIVADGADGLGGPVRAADPRGRSAAPSPVLRVLCEHARRAVPSPVLRVLCEHARRASPSPVLRVLCLLHFLPWRKDYPRTEMETTNLRPVTDTSVVGRENCRRQAESPPSGQATVPVWRRRGAPLSPAQRARGRGGVQAGRRPRRPATRSCAPLDARAGARVLRVRPACSEPR